MAEENEVVAQEQPAQQEQPAAVEQAAETPDRTTAIVQEWFAAHIANSPVSRSVDALNHVTGALPLLIETLKKG